jgi:predicted RNA-binding Zn ribbon-like protein
MDDFHFIAGDLALDFVNTVADRLSHPGEQLETGADVDRWALGAGLLGVRDSLHLNPRQVVLVHQVREELYRLLRPVALGSPPAADAMVRFERTHARVMRRRRLVWRDSGFAWEWSDLDRLLGPVVNAAAELLVSVPSSRMRQCADAGCGWMFLDRSRAGRRQWCRMVDCGNRAKARRHYQRSRRS